MKTKHLLVALTTLGIALLIAGCAQPTNTAPSAALPRASETAALPPATLAPTAPQSTAAVPLESPTAQPTTCLLYTSDAADE